MVSCGCAAGMKHVTAACVTGGNPEKLIRLPDLTGFEKTEVVIPRMSRNTYDAAIRNIGVTMKTVDTPEDFEKALSSRTAMIYIMSNNHYDGPFSLENIVRMAKPLNIPILVDAAAEDLTIPNVYLEKGATVVAYSGGKAMCGPQNAGLLLGNKALLLSAWQASAPHHGTGRDNKVAKDTAIGMVATVEAWVKRDHAAKEREWLLWLENIGKRVSAISGVTYTVSPPRAGVLNNRNASLRVSWNPEVLNVIGTEVSDELFSTKPRIRISGTLLDDNGMTSISVSAKNMQPGEDKIVADRLFEVLSRKHEKKPTGMKPASVNISGRWSVDIEFYSSKSRHLVYIEQEGNYIAGSHRGEFTTRDLNGIVDGDEIRFSSNERRDAQSAPFTFYGKATNDKMEGGVYMGEYLNAKFIATRFKQTPNVINRPILPENLIRLK
jgi:seryl-tRNA(Sec) selenium transferase